MKLLQRGTPQFDAIQWLANEDPYLIAPNSSNLVQRFVLMTLYFAMAGQAWETISEGGDGSDVAAWRGSCHECEWYLVQCGHQFDFEPQINSPNDYEKTNLSSRGTVQSPKSHPCLHSKEYYSSHYSGENNEGIGLVSGLRLHSLSLSGSVPSEIGLLHHLRFLDFRRNFLFGTIPKELYQLKKLEHLIMQYNEFHGSIDEDIGSLTNLETLSLHDNPFEGTFPSTFPNLVNLRRIYFYSTNAYEYPLEYITNHTYLEEFVVYEVSGTIPTEIGKLKNLGRFEVEGTKLHGSLPTELGQLEFMREQGNQFLIVSFYFSFANAFKTKSEIFNAQCRYCLFIPFTPCKILPVITCVGLCSESFHVGNSNISGSIPTEIGRLKNPS